MREKMSCKVFYSWQSDHPNSTNRGFIETALENAAKSIRNDNSIEVEPVIDRDTIGIPGAPDISSTIFAKIDQAQVFVCDVSIINVTTSSRPTPNPNVLLELGYALKTLGSDRIIMVMNSAFGGPELLPFDLRMKRVVTYHMPEMADERAPERKKLKSLLEQGLRIILSQQDKPAPSEVIQPLSIGEQTKAAIENSQPNQAYLARRFMEWLENELVALAPDFSGEGELDELLVQAIDQAVELEVEFAQLAETIAATNAVEAATAVYKGFGHILAHYDLPSGFSGSFRDVDFDYYKFIGHELFVTFFSFLVREQRWELIADLLEEDIPVENSNVARAGVASFDSISEYIKLLQYRNDRLNLRRISLHADLLHQRHTQGALGKVVPIEQFLDADYFLFLRAQIQTMEPSQWIEWKPWSALYLRGRVPRYLAEAVRAKSAQRLLRPIGVESVEVLRSRFAERAPELRRLFNDVFGRFDPLGDFDPQTIATR
jgi:hypothetical protein